MNDRELLELAARAAGIKVVWNKNVLSGVVAPEIYHRGNKFYIRWNPLEDDGDAFRLAVRLEFDLRRYARHAVEVTARIPIDDAPGEYMTVRQEVVTDAFAATRRAIVRAAAEIGKTM